MSTKHPGSEREIRALNAFITLMRAAETLTIVCNRKLSLSGLTETQFGTLEALYHLGPLHSGELAGKLLKSGGNLTLVLEHLELRGLVIRSRDVDDRRFVTVELSDSGRELMRQIFPDHAAFITSLMDNLSDPEQEQLRELCRKLGRAVDADNN